MKIDRSSMLMYAVTDRAWLNGKALEEQVEEAILGGATFIQLREKEADYDSFLEQAKKIKVITDKYKIPFVINDNIEVALACDADGVHVGQKDMAAGEVRKRLGKDKIIGVSVKNVQEAKEAEKNGADYLGIGAVFSTTTKLDAINVKPLRLQEIAAAVSIPIVAIGGIKKENVRKLRESHIDGIAVVSAIFAAENITQATKELVELAKEVVRKEQ